MAYCYPIAHHSFPQLPQSQSTFLSFHFMISTTGMRMTQCFRWVMSAGVCVLPFLTTKDFGLLLVEQETEVLPDQTLLQLVEDAECERKNAHYLEFLLALAICNTVVVSTKAARRQRVREMIMLTLPLLLRTALCTHELCHNAKNSLDVKIIALIVHHAQ